VGAVAAAARNTMPTVQDEEESLCLLASDLQESQTPAPNPKSKKTRENKVGDQKHYSVAHSDCDIGEDCWDDDDLIDDEDNQEASFLSQGTAEKAFFNVCKTNDEEEEEEDDCVEVMNDIIGELEADHEAAVNAAEAAAAGISGSEMKTESRNSRSLVVGVDIHLPPATSATEEDEEEDANNVQQQHQELLQQPPQPQQPPVTVAAASRPCKHEVNRFQRCYSDGSQASPKKKAKVREQLRHSHFGDQLSEAYSMREENLDRIETVICDNEQLVNSRRITGTKAKRQQLQPGQNFRGSTLSEGSSNVGLLRGAAFGIQQEFMQFKNSLLEGKANISDAKQKRKSDSEVYASDSPSPLVKFEMSNDHGDNCDTEDEQHPMHHHNKEPDEVKVEVVKNSCKPHKFIYPRLNFFGGATLGGLSSSVGDSCSATATPSDSIGNGSYNSQKFGHTGSDQNSSKHCMVDGGSSSNMIKQSSPFTFFAMDSDDDFDPYGSDVPSDLDTKRDLLGHGGLENQNVDIENTSCLSMTSSNVSLPVCRICQLPGVEPSNPLISPCRCLGSIRYVHNNCLLKWLEVSSRRRSGPPCCELCQYQYLRHKKFVISHWRFPECSLRDKFLHFFFIVNVCLMIACAAVTIICFKEVEPVREPILNRQPHIDLFFQDGVPYRAPNYHASELTVPELITVSCGILFFLAFFLAIYVEVKAKHTVYQLICKFFYMNHEWSVEEYDRKRDIAESRKKKEKESKKRKFRNNRRLQIGINRRGSSSSRQAASAPSAPTSSSTS